MSSHILHFGETGCRRAPSGLVHHDVQDSDSGLISLLLLQAEGVTTSGGGPTVISAAGSSTPGSIPEHPRRLLSRSSSASGSLKAAGNGGIHSPTDVVSRMDSATSSESGASPTGGGGPPTTLASDDAGSVSRESDRSSGGGGDRCAEEGTTEQCCHASPASRHVNCTLPSAPSQRSAARQQRSRVLRVHLIASRDAFEPLLRTIVRRPLGSVAEEADRRGEEERLGSGVATGTSTTAPLEAASASDMHDAFMLEPGAVLVRVPHLSKFGCRVAYS